MGDVIVLESAKRQDLTLPLAKRVGAPIDPEKADVKYEIARLTYRPRKDHTRVAWEKVVAAIQAGLTSHEELCRALDVHFSRVDENHHDFIGYMVRRGNLREV